MRIVSSSASWVRSSRLVLLQPLDLDFQLGALLRDCEAVIAGIEAAQLVDDVERECREHQNCAGDDVAAGRRVLCERPGWARASELRMAAMKRFAQSMAADAGSGSGRARWLPAHHDGKGGAPFGKACGASSVQRLHVDTGA